MEKIYKLERKGLAERVAAKMKLPREAVLPIVDNIIEEMVSWVSEHREPIELRGLGSIHSTISQGTTRKVFGEEKQTEDSLKLHIKVSKTLKKSVRNKDEDGMDDVLRKLKFE